MNYVTYAQLAKDVAAWSERLPRNYDAIVAVPRSGIIPAAMLALHRNIKLTDIVSFRGCSYLDGGYRDHKKIVSRVLVVDDSSLSGKSLSRAREMLSGIKDIQIDYGAVYVHNLAPKYYFKRLPAPRIFEWNVYHHYWLRFACVDIDGVLCRDPSAAENDDSDKYLTFLQNAQPRHLPTVAINTLVTSRLERYRRETVIWLAEHGITYSKLIMHPASTAHSRRQAGDHAERKAQVYRSDEYRLFIESSTRQAIKINLLTRKPVLCTDENRLYV